MKRMDRPGFGGRKLRGEGLATKKEGVRDQVKEAAVLEPVAPVPEEVATACGIRSPPVQGKRF